MKTFLDSRDIAAIIKNSFGKSKLRGDLPTTLEADGDESIQEEDEEEKEKKEGKIKSKKVGRMGKKKIKNGEGWWLL